MNVLEPFGDIGQWLRHTVVTVATTPSLLVGAIVGAVVLTVITQLWEN